MYVYDAEYRGPRTAPWETSHKQDERKNSFNTKIAR